MKRGTKVLAVVFAFAACFATGCKKDNKGERFGEFSYNGKYLTRYARNEISASEAKSLIRNKTKLVSHSVTEYDYTYSLLGVNTIDPKDTPAPPKSLVDSVLTEYGGLDVVTKYYIEQEEELQKKNDLLQGTDLKYVIEENKFAPFSQLVAKGIVIFEELIDYMEEQNELFRASEMAKIAPFQNIFAYYTDRAGNIIIHTHNFAEIPSSVGGGIGCNFRQDVEIVYDSENKICKWQTSLGIYTATPKGTMKQGYISEIEFDWLVKDR